MHEELQAGHRQVVRVGDTVRRRAEWWTAAVHHQLGYLHDIGFPYAPRPLGIDADGREVLSYIDGESGRAQRRRVVTDGGLRAYARLLRTYHDAVAGYVPPANAEWAFGARPLHAGEIMCHGDFGSWNLVWRGDEPIGILDWDLAFPGPPLDDVTYALIYSVPFRSDDDAMTHFGFDAPPNRPHRIEVFADAYGVDTDGLVDAVIERQRRYACDIEYLRDRGLDAPWTSPASVRARTTRPCTGRRRTGSCSPSA